MDLTWQMLLTGAVTLGIATYAIKKATYATKEGELRFGAFMKILGLICVAFSIVFSTPWSGTKTERWEKLESIKFSGTCSWHLLKFKSGKVIPLPSFLNGHGNFLNF